MLRVDDTSQLLVSVRQKQMGFTGCRLNLCSLFQVRHCGNRISLQ